MADKKGYSGTALLSKISRLNIIDDMGMWEHVTEERVEWAEYENFILVNVYVPTSEQKLNQLEYRK